MLPSFIIEEIKKRERERLGRDDRPGIELPIEAPVPRPRPAGPAPDGDAPSDSPDGDRAVVIRW